MAAGPWARPTHWHTPKTDWETRFGLGGMQPCPLLTIRISGPCGVTAGQAANLLEGLEELWQSMAGGPGESRLQLVAAGTGSIWFRVMAECRKSPVMTFVSFVSAIAAVCSASSGAPGYAAEPVGKTVGKAHSSFHSKPQEKLQHACDAITKDGGKIELKVEDAGGEFASISAEQEAASADVLKLPAKQVEPGSSRYGGKYGFDIEPEPDDFGEKG